ncbi:MAG: I78 family peptidase inhibitor [Stenotrophomonas sp.]|uniref:I78 family peptidase inhibitor n=1 Tax=Stenotrophomonas sp. TaxID=69392 RepID=UPI003D6CEE4E
MRLPVLMLVAGVLPLAACASPPKTSSAPPATLDPAPVVAEGAGNCNPDKLTGLTGQVATEALVKKAVADSGAKHARVVKPGMAVTMDFREDRLTINVDAQNKIERIGCN